MRPVMTTYNTQPFTGAKPYAKELKHPAIRRSLLRFFTDTHVDDFAFFRNGLFPAFGNDLYFNIHVSKNTIYSLKTEHGGKM